MHEFLTIYLAAAVVAIFISEFLGRYSDYKKLLYVGVYCLVVPVFAALASGEVGRWSIVISNSAGLLFVGLALWLSGRKRATGDSKGVDEAVVDQTAT